MINERYSIAAKIREKRTQKGLTQEDVAKLTTNRRTDKPYSSHHIERIESGKEGITAHLLLQLFILFSNNENLFKP